jgi:serine/threonine protein kinase
MSSRENPDHPSGAAKRTIRSSDIPPVPDPEPPDPEVLPAGVPYRLLRRLGAGAYGEVFEAEAPGGFHVAVKRILRSAGHPASQGEEEALKVMKAMSHPFLVQTHAYWVFRDRLVIVMELADGSLAGEVERHKAEGRPGVPPEELVPFFEQAAEALDYLHGQRVTHRDLKPENLLLLKGYAKVADFGLARGHEHEQTRLTAEVGTPLYMAPEVWKRNYSRHSDQYSLAATYVAARLGRPVFEAESVYDAMMRHIQDTPDLDPLPPAEQEVLQRALAKRPDDRYPSCAAFAAALRDAAFPAPPPVVVRRRTALWVGLVAGFGAAGGLVAKLTRTPDPGPSPPPPPPVVPPVPPAPPLPTPVEPQTPPGWTPVKEAGKQDAGGGHELYKRLVREVGGETLEALLIPRTRPTDPPSFYMLRNKITNRVFKAIWDAAEERSDSRVKWFRGLVGGDAEVVARYLPGDWKKDRTTFDGTPVLGVNGVEAILVAQELGGQVPTYDQWLKAVGAKGDGDPPGPAGPERHPGENLFERQPPLALGLDGPWPVERVTADESKYGIHQLVSNGYEWADGRDDARRTRVEDLPSDHPLPLTGMTWELPEVLTFDRMAREPRLSDWISTDAGAGFRVVLLPPA